MRIPDGRLIHATYDFEPDEWTLWFDGADHASSRGRWAHAVIRTLVGGVPAGEVSPRWMNDAAERLAERDTLLGIRVMCRCCGFLTLPAYGRYDICRVCNWEDDPTTILHPGEDAGPGPNHVSLLEGRSAFADTGNSTPQMGSVSLRAPLPAEYP